MRTNPLFCTLALTVLVAPAAAQGVDATATLTGTVVDGETGVPLVAARVQILPAHLDESTRSDGRFAFAGVPPGAYTLVVEHLGYRRWTRDVTLAAGAREHVRIEMRVAAIELGGIVVTGSLRGRAREDVLSPVTMVAGAELDRRMDATVAATLENQPGLAAASLGPVTARPVIRGLGGDRIVMLEDGHRTGDLSSTSSDHAVAIDPITARNIEVVRGPMSLLYGSSALGGVVNVVRDEIPIGVPDHLHGRLTVQGTSANDGITGGGFATRSIGTLALRGEASYRRSSDIATPAGTLVNTGARTISVASGAGLTTSWGHAGAAYRFYGNNYGIPGGFIGGHERGVDIEMQRHSFRGEVEWHRGGNLFDTFRATTSYTNYHHRELEQSGAIGTEFSQDVVNVEVVSTHGAHGRFTEGAFGVRAQYRDIRTAGSLRTPSTYDYSVAGFLVEELAAGSFRLQAGMRYDVARYVPRDTSAFVTAGGQRIPVRARTFGAFSASAGVLWVASPVIRVGASLARAYRTPDFNELYSNGPHLAANSYDVGDPRIEHETGLGADLFVRFTHDRLRAELAAYHNTLSNYIFPSSRGRAELGAQGGRPRFQYTNEDARFVGVEAELNVPTTPALVFEANASLVHAEFTSARAPIPVLEATDTTFVPASQYPPLIPPPRARLGARWERPSHFAGAGVKLVARQQRLGDFESPTDAHALLDLNAGVRIVQGDRLHTITVRVENAFDTTYRDHLSRVKDIMPGAGRNISLLYRLAF